MNEPRKTKRPVMSDMVSVTKPVARRPAGPRKASTDPAEGRSRSAFETEPRSLRSAIPTALVRTGSTVTRGNRLFSGAADDYNSLEEDDREKEGDVFEDDGDADVDTYEYQDDEYGDDADDDESDSYDEDEDAPYGRYDRERENRYRRLTRPRRGAGCFLWTVMIVAALSLAIGIGGLLARADVSIVPKTWTGTVDEFVTISQVRAEKTVMFGTVTKTFTDEEVVSATSVSTIESSATGTVRFYNAGSVGRSIPAGAALTAMHSGDQYLTRRTVTIPAAKGKVPGQADVLITAVRTGSAYNSDPDDFSLPSGTKDPSVITVRSITPLSGGIGIGDAVADPSAISDAASRLREKFSDATSLSQRIFEELPDSMIVLPVSFPSAAPAITVESNHADGVHVVARDTVTLLLVPKADIARVFAADLSVPGDVPVTLPSFDGLTVTTSGIVAGRPVPDQVQVRITGTATIFGAVAADSFRGLLSGKSKTEVRNIALQNKAVGSVDIHMTPFWRRILPLDSEKISITVKEPLI